MAASQQPTPSPQQQRPRTLSPQPVPSTTQGSGPPEIDPNDIVLEHTLGDGSFGTVYKGRCRHKDVAVKVLFRQFDEATLQAFRQEVAIMSKVFHPNVSLFMGACTSIPGKLMMCNELLKQDLESLLLDNKIQLPLLLRMNMARDAALGMHWLHTSNPVIVHRDLKSSNLLVDEHYNVKVCDFGLSQFKVRGENLLDGNEGAKGTPLWMAPEILSGTQFNEKADVYSFGLILWQILTREDIFPEYDNLERFAYDVCKKHVRPPIPASTNTRLAELIKNCWQANADTRPNFSQIVAKLNEIILEESINDQSGRDFWKFHFQYRESVTWQEFVNAFSAAHQVVASNVNLFEVLQYQPRRLGDNEIRLKCLKAILVEPAEGITISAADQDVVSMEQFGSILAWFGKFSEGVQLLEKMRALMSTNWFHGDISTADAEVHLMHKPEGTFLVRFSTSEPGAYTISKVSMFNSISHQRIVHKPSSDAYTINGNTYSSVQELVDKEKQSLNLLVACPDSRFAVLFANANIQGYINT